MSRLRDLGISIGRYPPGRLNAISDIDGVTVGHCTVVHDEPRVARTGVTIVNTRGRSERDSLCYGGFYSFNGNGEMTGSHWLEESGLLNGPIGITNTHQVGLVRDTLVEAESRPRPRGRLVPARRGRDLRRVPQRHQRLQPHRRTRPRRLSPTLIPRNRSPAGWTRATSVAAPA